MLARLVSGDPLERESAPLSLVLGSRDGVFAALRAVVGGFFFSNNNGYGSTYQTEKINEGVCDLWVAWWVILTTSTNSTLEQFGPFDQPSLTIKI